MTVRNYSGPRRRTWATLNEAAQIPDGYPTSVYALVERYRSLILRVVLRKLPAILRANVSDMKNPGKNRTGIEFHGFNPRDRRMIGGSAVVRLNPMRPVAIGVVAKFEGTEIFNAVFGPKASIDDIATQIATKFKGQYR